MALHAHHADEYATLLSLYKVCVLAKSNKPATGFAPKKKTKNPVAAITGAQNKTTIPVATPITAVPKNKTAKKTTTAVAPITTAHRLVLPQLLRKHASTHKGKGGGDWVTLRRYMETTLDLLVEERGDLFIAMYAL